MSAGGEDTAGNEVTSVHVTQKKWIFRTGLIEKRPWGCSVCGARGADGEGQEMRTELMVTGHRRWGGRGEFYRAGFCKASSENLKYQAEENPHKAAITVISAPHEDCGDVCTHASVISILKQESASTDAAASSIVGAYDNKTETSDGGYLLHHISTL